MRRTLSIGIAVVLALVATGCDPDDPPGPTASSSSSSTSTPTPTPTGTPDMPPPSDMPTNAPQGANAAPPAGGVYDASQAAADNYLAWILYEMALPQDTNRDYETEVYPDGVFVCTRMAMQSDVRLIEDYLAGTKGYTGSGAASIIKAALNSLCPHRNQGYKTYFDRQVDSATTALATSMTWSAGPPPFYEIGYFVKFVCGYLQRNGSANNLEVTLHSYRTGGVNQGRGGFAGTFMQHFDGNDRLLRIATHHAVFHGCLGDHSKLNGYWTMA